MTCRPWRAGCWRTAWCSNPKRRWMAIPTSGWWAPFSKPRQFRGRCMHFALRGYLFIMLTALLGVAGTWSDEPAFASAWLFPACLLLAGLAAEAWYWRGTKLAARMDLDSRLKLGRPTSGALTLSHNRGRELTLQYARVLPPQVRQSSEVREIVLPPGEPLREPVELLPLRLGAGRFTGMPARLLGLFRFAWWSGGL